MLWPSTPGAPRLAFTALKASHTILFEMANGFAVLTSSSRKRLACDHGWTMSPLRSIGFRQLPRYYGRLRPCAPHRYLHPHGVRPLGLFPSHRSDRFSRSASKPGSGSRRLYAERHPASRQAPAGLRPGPAFRPGFDATGKAHDTSSAVHLRSSSRTLTCRDLGRGVSSTLTTLTLNRRSSRWFGNRPCSLFRGAAPHL